MKKSTILSSCLVLSTLSAIAQLPRWDGINYGYTSGGSHNSIREIAAAPDGSIFVAGRYNGDLYFRDGKAGFGNSKDAFLAKVNPDGTFAWGKGEGHRANDTQTRTVTTDQDGNVYVAGDFEYAASIGGVTVNATGNSFDGYIVSYDPAGAKRWSKIIRGNNNIAPLLIRTDAEDNVILSGFFDTDVDFGGGQTLNRVGTGHFLVAFTASGGFLWKKDVGRPDSPIDMKVAADGSIYRLYRTVQNDTVKLDGITSYSEKAVNVVLVKSNAIGTVSWIRQLGGTMTGFYGENVIVDTSGNVFVAGSVGDSLTYDGTLIRSSGSPGGFIVKIDPNGNLVDQLFTTESIGTIVGDGRSRFYAGGGFDGTFSVGGKQVTSVNGSNFYVMELNTDFSVNWITAGGEGGVTSVRLATSGSDFYVGAVSYYNGTIKVGDSTLIKNGLNNFFTANLLLKEKWTGIQEKKGQLLSVFPNPFQSHLTLSLPYVHFTGNMQLFNTTGQVVLDTKVQHAVGTQMPLNASALPSGIYYYALNDDKGQQWSGKLVKQ
jgi:hypothetical protein